MAIKRGLYHKYDIFKAGTDEPIDSFAFVLKPANDMAARVALRAYAKATDDRRLAADLTLELDWIEAGSGSESTNDCP